MNDIFKKHATEIIRVSVVQPKAETAPAPVKSKHLWVPHPSPRNLVHVSAEKIIESLPDYDQ